MSRSSLLSTPGRALAALGLLLTLLALAAPAAQAEDGNGVPPGKAWVRVGHFVPGMGATSIALQPLDGQAAPVMLAASATYGQVTDYGQLAPGRYTATVRETSADPASAPMLSRSFDIAANDARTVAVLGSSEAPRLALLTDDLTPPEPGTARVRLLSASEAADSVTVRALAGPTIAEGAVLGQATDYATVPAGSWTLQLQSDQADAASATLQDVPVMSGSVYTVVVLDDADQTVRLDVVTDAAGAMAAPQGGAKTGGGGTAARPVAASDDGGTAVWMLGAVGALLAAGAASGLFGGRHPGRSLLARTSPR